MFLLFGKRNGVHIFGEELAEGDAKGRTDAFQCGEGWDGVSAVDVCYGGGRQAGLIREAVSAPSPLFGQFCDSLDYVHIMTPFPFYVLYKGGMEEKRFYCNKNSVQMSKNVI